jgi:thiamine phosphate synthase YjbQ (UPF0047 family)
VRNSGVYATYTEELTINTPKRYQIICITNDVERIVKESGIVDGLVLVNPMHITASCYVNDLEYGLHHDIMAWLEKLAPIMDKMVNPVMNISIMGQVRITVMHI